MFKFIEAKTVNDITEPGTTLGIEITDKDVATCCRLGNLDGQHGTGRWTDVRVNYISEGGSFGLPANLCVISIGPVIR